jgi:hypothetical protein
MTEVDAPHRKLCPKVVAGDHAGQGLGGSKGIVREDASKLLQTPAAERDRGGRS